MLVLPVRRPQHFVDNDTSPCPSPPALQISNTQSSQTETARNMTSSMPAMRPPTQGSGKPRLTLNTANVTSLPSGAKSRTALCLSAVTGSPTYRNTYTNAFEAAPSKRGQAHRHALPSLSRNPQDARRHRDQPVPLRLRLLLRQTAPHPFQRLPPTFSLLDHVAYFATARYLEDRPSAVDLPKSTFHW